MKGMSSARFGCRLTLFLLMALSICFLATAGPAKAAGNEAIRDAFMLGFTYGNGHNLYSLYPTLGGETRAGYDSWMSDATEYGKRLGVVVDTTPPPYDVSSGSAQVNIIQAGRHQASLLGIRLRARHSEQPAVALELGYKAALAIEYVPLLDSAIQRQVVEEYNSLAQTMSLPVSIVDAYMDVLLSTTNRERAVTAMFRFKDAVVGHYEGLTVATAEGARRQLYVWLMGWKLGLATLGQTRGADASTVSNLFEESRAFAEGLGVRLPTLPEASTDSARDTAQAFHYLLQGAGEFVNPQLDSRFGPHASALFELAVKSTLAMLLYGPDDDLGQTLRDVIDRTGRESGLPGYVYEPLVRKMSRRAAYSEVKQEIIALNDRVTAYYSSGPSGGAAQGQSGWQPTQQKGWQLAAYQDPAGFFGMVYPSDWRVERTEGWDDENITYYRHTMFAPRSAHQAQVSGYLSEGVRVTFQHPPQDRVWTMSAMKDWAPIYIEKILGLNPDFVVTGTSSVSLSGQPALEYQMVGVNAEIHEPEINYFFIVTNERYRVIVNLVSPESKLENFKSLRKTLLDKFVLLQ